MSWQFSPPYQVDLEPVKLLVRNERVMTKVLLWALLAIVLWPLPSRSKMYRYNITRLSKKNIRWWGGPESNTGKNFGGWLFRVTHPDQVSLCGASYYSPLLMIVSATCIHPFRYDMEGTSVEPTFTDANVYGLVDNVHIPPRYIFHRLYMDVALIRLQDPVRGRTTEFIKLCNKTIKPGMVMTVYGWGFDSMETSPKDLNLKSATVPVESIKSCRKKYKDSDIRLSSTSFCVTHPVDPRKCLYDGGSPLTYGNELCGVVSFGPICSNTKQPGIYTDINKMVDYIEKIEREIDLGLLRLAPVSRPRKAFGKVRKNRLSRKHHKTERDYAYPT